MLSLFHIWSKAAVSPRRCAGVSTWCGTRGWSQRRRSGRPGRTVRSWARAGSVCRRKQGPLPGLVDAMRNRR